MNQTIIIALSLMLAFTRSLVLADAPGQIGFVDFAFDGGTLKCEFGTEDAESKRSVAYILHPESMKAATGRKNVILIPGTLGSAVFTIDSDSIHRQLDRGSATEWARERVSEMAVRPSSVAENAFVAAVMHTLSTGTPVLVWANDGVDLLKAGNWSGLFNPTLQASDNFPSVDDPFF
jgi:hypothetical protein